MGLSLWNIFKAGLLCTNALLILNRRRFLAKYGFDVDTMDASESPLKYQAANFISAAHYLKVPVIAANCVTIVFEFLLGG
mmetsp:Transcript_23675/g.35993  ORF Transcript_23675/g.35993 Transcript_23675/m.35993 type:complete len:80 (-) Transcript_23675:297-536(-)